MKKNTIDHQTKRLYIQTIGKVQGCDGKAIGPNKNGNRYKIKRLQRTVRKNLNKIKARRTFKRRKNKSVQPANKSD